MGEIRAILSADRSRYSREIKLAAIEHRGFKRDAERPLRIDGDAADYIRALDRARAHRNRFLVESARAVAKIGGATTIAGLGVLGGQAAAGGALALASALSQTAGAAALLPAAGAAAATGLAAIAVGMEGVGEAIKSADDLAKWDAALRDLAPNARATAIAVKALGAQAGELRREVQDELFAGLADEITDLGNVYLPVLRRGLADTAREINNGAVAFSDWMQTPRTVSDVAAIIDNTRLAFREASPAGQAFAQILRDITAEGSERLPAMASGLTSVAVRWADIVAQARESGALDEWIDRGIATAQQFGQVIGNVGGTVAAVLDAGENAGAGLLDTLEDVTARIEEWAKTNEGQAAIGGLFTAASQAADALLPLAAEAASVLGDDLAPALVDIGTKLAPAAADGVSAMGDALDLASPGATALADGMADLVTSASPVLPVVGRIAGAVGQVLGPVLTATAGVVGELVEGFADLPGPIQAAIVAALGWRLVGDRISAGAGTLRNRLVEPWQRMREQVRVQTALAAREGTTNLSKLGAAAATLETHSPAVARMADSYRTWSSRIAETVSAHAALAGGLGGVDGKVTATGAAFDKAAGAAGRFGGAVAGTVAAGVSGLKSAAGGLIGVLGGPWGVALTGAAVLVGIWADQNAKAKAQQEAVSQSAREYTAALREQNGVVNDAVRAAAAKALEDHGILANAQALGLSLSEVTTAYIDQGTALDGLVGHLDNVIESGKIYESFDNGMGGSTSAWSGRLTETGERAQELKAKILDLAGETDSSVAADKRKAEALGGVGKSAEGATVRLSDLEKAAVQTTHGIDGAASAVRAFVTAMDQLRADTLTVEEAEQRVNDITRTLGESFTQAGAAAKSAGENVLTASGAINTATQEGSRLQNQVTDLASAYTEQYKAVHQATGSHEAAAKATQGVRDEFIKTATAALGNADAAKELANRYGLLPEVVETRIENPGLSTASFGLELLRQHVLNVPGEKGVIVSSNASPMIGLIKTLGLKVENLPDGNFRILANDDEARGDVDAFIREMNKKVIRIHVTTTGASGAIGVRGIPTANAEGRVMEYYADGGMRPMSGGAAAIVGSFRRTGAMRVIGDNPTHDELYAPLNRSERTKALLRIGMDRTWPGWQNNPAMLLGEDQFRRQMAAQRPDYWTAAPRGTQTAGGQATSEPRQAAGRGRGGNTFIINGPDPRRVAAEVVDRMRIEEMLYGGV